MSMSAMRGPCGVWCLVALATLLALPQPATGQQMSVNGHICFLFQGVTYRLVRHAPQGDQWGPYNDDGALTETHNSGEAGVINSVLHWTVPFVPASPTDSVLLMTGDQTLWGLTTPSNIAALSGSPAPFQWLGAVTNPNPFTSSCFRRSPIDFPEDPFLSLGDHGTNDMLYAEGSWSSTSFHTSTLRNNGGVDFFVEDIGCLGGGGGPPGGGSNPCLVANPCINGMCTPDGFGGVLCLCNPGFIDSGDGLTCVDFNECVTGAPIGPCGPNAQCQNTVGNFTCSCNQGFVLAGQFCVPDAGACSSAPCHPDADCFDIPGGFDCACKVGFIGDGISCSLDLNNNACASSPCDPNAQCVGTPSAAGNFTCLCNLGFIDSGDGITCVDFNECVTGAPIGPCGPNAQCQNTVGNFTCSCNQGFVLAGQFCVPDAGACSSAPCHPDADCFDIPGGFDCACKVGFIGDGISCSLDLNNNACASSPCDPNAQCASTPSGNFTCACGSGFVGDGITCMDIDECAQANPCDPNALCENVPGGFGCQCREGFSGDGITCADVDECLVERPGCTCQDLIPGFSCTCDEGLFGGGLNTECVEDPCLSNPCDPTATCTNAGADFLCVCGPGTVEDVGASAPPVEGNNPSIGLVCADVDECQAAVGCVACTNTPGSHNCTCPAGFLSGPVFNCSIDIDECATQTDNCSVFASCSNTVGGFNCTCDAEYSGDGVVCKAVNPAQALENLDLAGTAAELNGNPGNAQAARTALVGLADQAAAQVNATDTAGIGRVANLLVLVANNTGEDAATGAQIISTTTTLLTTLEDQPAALQSLSDAEPCGDAVCNARFETCATCEADCGPCSTPDLRNLVTQWRDEVFLHGAAMIQPVSASSEFALDVLNENSTLTQATVIDPTGALKPAALRFSGVSFRVNFTVPIEQEFPAKGNGQLPGQTDMLALAIDTSQLQLNRANGTFELRRFDEQNMTWVLEPCSSGSTFDEGSMVLTTTACTPGQYAVFIAGFVPQTSVVTSLANALGLAAESQAAVVGGGADAADLEAAQQVLDALNNVSTILASTLETGDPPIVVSTPKVRIEVLKEETATLAGSETSYGSDGLAVGLPSDLGRVATGPVTVTAIRYEDFPLKQATTFGSVLEYNLKGEDGFAVNINGEVEVRFEFPVPSNAEPFQINCSFYDSAAGVWSTEGVRRDNESSTETRTVCISKHLTPFGVDIDFTIEAPKVSATNFDPRNSYIIYGTFGGFYLLIAVAFLYSTVERRRYIETHKRLIREEAEAVEKKVQAGAAETGADEAEAGDVVVDVEAEAGAPGGAPEAPRSFWGLFFKTWKTQVYTALTTRHSWMAVVWPSGHKTFPKRFVKICALWATVSLALGMNAVFAFTATENTPPGEVRTVNTFLLRVPGGSVRVPLEGIYTFFIVLPVLLALSLSIGRYSILIDFLRKADPVRFLNDIVELDEGLALRGRARSKRQRAARSKEEGIEYGFELNRLQEIGPSAPGKGEGDTEEGADTAVDALGAPRVVPGGGEYLSVCEFDEPERAAKLSATAGVAPSPSRQQHPERWAGLERRKSMRASSHGEFPWGGPPAKQGGADELDLEPIVKKMLFWRRVSVGMTLFVVTAGMFLALLFVGSYTAEKQERWIKGVGEFLVFSALITSPFFLFVLATSEAFSKTKKAYYATDSGDDAPPDPADLENLNARVLTGIKSSTTAKNMTKAMMQVELGRALRSNLNFSVL